MSSNENLDVYDTLLHWRNANSKRQTSFESFLRRSAFIYFFQNESVDDNPASPMQPTNVRNSRHRDKQIPVSWVSAFTGRTPKKNVNKQYEERKEVLDMNDVVERRERCTGYCVFRVTIDEDGKETLKGEGTMNRCALCKKNTRHFCINCHTWLCGPSTPYFDEGNKKSVAVYTDSKTRREMHFRLSCFQIFHDQGLTKAKGDTNSDL